MQKKPSDCLTTGLPNNSQDTTDARRDHVLTCSILGAALRYRARGSEPTPATDNSLAEGSLRDFNRSWPQDQSQSVTYSVPSTHQPAFARLSSSEAPRARNAEDTLIEEIGAVCQSIPPSIYDMQTVREDHFARIAREYAFQALSLWFLSPLPKIRDSIASQTIGRRTVRAMYFEATTFQLLSQDLQNGSATIKKLVDWIDRYGQKLATDFRRNSSPSDMIDCFNAHLELVLLKFVMLDGISAYTLQRTALPMFLSLVTAEPSLLVDQPNGSLAVSFVNTLCSPRHELARFVGNDVILPFLLGVPPLAEYAYDSTCGHDQFEWVHGVPIPLLQIISQVNSWRARSKILIDDWQTLEQRALAWRSPYDTSDVPFVPESATSEMAAVREGWRHVVLIYIYMGICGVSSHDLRVQVSVDRILQLSSTLHSSHIGMHMLPHCFVAGVAARLESQRAAVYKKLFLLKGSRLWVFGGSQISLFLYHLWHSAGAGGGPVTWDDYVQSREAVTPV
ncbi:hypothetical protein RHS03_06651, partial [Rhizoctonia solani]